MNFTGRRTARAPRAFARFLAVLFVAGAAPSGAATLHVPRDQASIQGAIDHSAPFDTILVAPGQYEAGLVVSFAQRGIVLTSEKGMRETILVGRSGSRIITFDEADTLTEISGFTLRGGNPQFDGGAIYAYRSQILVAECDISGNETLGDGGAIALYESWALIWKNTLTANSARQGGALFSNSSTVTLAGNTFRNNNASQDGGGLFLMSSAPTLDGNNIQGNRAVSDGGGVVFSGSQGEFRNNYLARNAARRGGGFVCEGGFQPDLTSNRFAGNVPDDLAGCSSRIIEN